MIILPTLTRLATGSGIVDWILGAIASTMMGVADLLFGNFLELMENRNPLELFDSVFPGVNMLSNAINAIAIALAVVTIMFAIASNFFTSDTSIAESPVSVVLRSMVFIPLILVSKSLCFYMINIEHEASAVLSGGFEAMNSVKSVSDVLKTEGFTFSDALSRAVNFASSTSGARAIGVIPTLAVLIVVTVVFIDYCRLMLEIIEQYVMVGVLVYLSPLAFSTGCTKRTSQIFWSWFNMLATHLLLLLLSQWSVGVFGRGIVMLMHYNAGTLLGATVDFSPLVTVIALDALLRIATHWEAILMKLGLKSVATGMGVVSTMLMATKIFGGIFGAPGKIMNMKEHPFGLKENPFKGNKDGASKPTATPQGAPKGTPGSGTASPTGMPGSGIGSPKPATPSEQNKAAAIAGFDALRRSESISTISGYEIGTAHMGADRIDGKEGLAAEAGTIRNSLNEADSFEMYAPSSRVGTSFAQVDGEITPAHPRDDGTMEIGLSNVKIMQDSGTSNITYSAENVVGNLYPIDSNVLNSLDSSDLEKAFIVDAGSPGENRAQKQYVFVSDKNTTWNETKSSGKDLE